MGVVPRQGGGKGLKTKSDGSVINMYWLFVAKRDRSQSTETENLVLTLNPKMSNVAPLFVTRIIFYVIIRSLAHAEPWAADLEPSSIDIMLACRCRESHGAGAGLSK